MLAGGSLANLDALLAELREEPELADSLGTSASSVSRAFAALWHGLRQPESVEDAGSGRPLVCETASLPKLLQHFCTESCSFRSVLRQLYEQSPSTAASPFHLVMYMDEAVPGNVLRLDNRRKTWCVYVSVRELGQSYLKRESMWLPIALIRSTIAKSCSGGFSACIKAILRRWFLTDRIHERGILLGAEAPGARYVVFHFVLGNITAGGDALRAVFLAKGASGKLPCMACKNVVSDRIRSDYFVHIDCPSISALDRASDDDIWCKVDRLAEARDTLTRASFNDLQMVHGFNDHPAGLLQDRELRQFLRPAACLTYDAMHVFVANGIAQNQVGSLLASLHTVGVTWGALRDFAEAGWEFCRAHAHGKHMLKACFAKARENAHRFENVFKASASEMLLVAPVLAHFLYRVVAPTGAIADEVRAFAALCDVLAQVRRSKEGKATAVELREAVERHARAFNASYADAKPKNHYALHVPLQYQRDGVVLDCFVGERKNGTIKRAAASVKLNEGFERAVLARVVELQVAALREPEALCNRLLRPQASEALAVECGTATAALSLAMQWDGTVLGAGDCVYFDGALYCLAGCVAADGTFYVIADAYDWACAVQLEGFKCHHAFAVDVLGVLLICQRGPLDPAKCHHAIQLEGPQPMLMFSRLFLICAPFPQVTPRAGRWRRRARCLLPLAGRPWELASGWYREGGDSLVVVS